MDGAINEFLLGLHRASKRMPHECFRPWLFDALQPIVPFDSAFWFRWSSVGSSTPLHAYYLYRLPSGFLAEGGELDLWRDHLAGTLDASSAHGRSVRAARGQRPAGGRRCPLGRDRQAHILVSSVDQVLPETGGGAAFYRHETQAAFNADDAGMLESLMPHMADAWRENWLRHAARAGRAAPTGSDFSIAILTPDRFMSDAEEEFCDLLRLEWPGWHGPTLPPPLHAQLASEVPARWSGKAVTVYARHGEGGWRLMMARRAHALDRLPPRKRQVALLFAHGASQTEIAHQLHLTPSTVNNYLGVVYQELQLSDKTDLSRLVMRLEP